MDGLLPNVVGILAAGVFAKAAGVGGEAVAHAYDALRALVIRKLGKGGALQSLEDDPSSEAAQTALAEALIKAGLAGDPELALHAEALRATLVGAGSDDANIDVGEIVGKVRELLGNLVASGRIKLGDIRAETGDAALTNLTAGSIEERRRAEEAAVRLAEERRRAGEAAARLAEEQREAERTERFEEERRKADETRSAEEQREAERAERFEEERRKVDETRSAEEQRRAEEAARLAEEQREEAASTPLGQSGGVHIIGSVGSVGGDIVGDDKIVGVPPAVELSDFRTKVRSELGSILWNPPNRMRVWRCERIEVRVGDADVAIEALSEGLRGRGVGELHPVWTGHGR
jgi:hypothetical protein